MQFELTHKDLIRFWKKILPNSETGCWEWTGSYTSDKGNGYRCPKLTIQETTVLARRMSYLIAFGAEPAKVGYSCGNYKCVNPSHLTPMVAKQAKISKTLSTKPAKDWVTLDDKLARRIITLRKGGKTWAEIHRRTGVSPLTAINVSKMARYCKEGRLSPSQKAGV